MTGAGVGLLICEGWGSGEWEWECECECVDGGVCGDPVFSGCREAEDTGMLEGEAFPTDLDCLTSGSGGGGRSGEEGSFESAVVEFHSISNSDKDPSFLKASSSLRFFDSLRYSSILRWTSSSSFRLRRLISCGDNILLAGVLLCLKEHLQAR